jgi:hypothetical protein
VEWRVERAGAAAGVLVMGKKTAAKFDDDARRRAVLLQGIDDARFVVHFVERIASINGALRSSTQQGNGARAPSVHHGRDAELGSVKRSRAGREKSPRKNFCATLAASKPEKKKVGHQAPWWPSLCTAGRRGQLEVWRPRGARGHGSRSGGEELARA